MRRILCVLIGVMLAVGLPGCHDYARDLPGGYKLVRTNASEIIIFPPPRVRHPSHKEGLVVFPLITKVAVKDEFVLGLVVPSPTSGVAQNGDSDPGYFILNTRTGQVHRGLARPAWDEMREALGIGDVELRSPRFIYFGWLATILAVLSLAAFVGAAIVLGSAVNARLMGWKMKAK